MNFKKYYKNGHSRIYIKTSKFEINILPYMTWNNFMYTLTMITTKPFVLDLKYTNDYYPYREGVLERIETWYGRKFIFGKKRQYTKSTFVNAVTKKQIKVKHFADLNA